MRYQTAVGEMLGRIGGELRRCFRSQRKTGARILVVRGSRLAGEMARIFKRYGLNSDLVERTSLLENARRTSPALILTDLSVGGISEVEDAMGLRQRLPACRVLLFSGEGLHRNSIPRGSEIELVRTIERLCANPQNGHMLWLDLARFIQAVPRHKSMAA